MACRALVLEQERGFKTNVLQVRKGNVVEINNVLSVVLKRESSMGRGTSTIKLDLQDLLTGTKHTERYRSGDMVEVTELAGIKCQFLYRNDGQIHLMDPESFEMYEVPETIMEEKQIQLLQEDMMVQLSMFQPDPDVPGKPISIRLPAQAIYVVKEAYPSAAQANKGTIYKNAELDNGIKVQIPDFVNIGDRVVVDTETGKYLKRA
ncbi:hypothetical protein BGZ80_010781 [Entomortierella chlamydospora]|uniref:Elongation factor p n=1 Tax=Entomortierella chlamydospora TaxID=101097 RepID=A0A9P6N2X7_9FUNG|nr:hypothetical protein BGZ79_001689 [Entomortierella chlamydospora]KAG0022944.1 hypothetical protein BGZ80_010781 [Entomortierella chlamydospora]